LKVRDASNALRAISAIRLRTVGGLFLVNTVRARDAANALRVVYSSMTLTISDDSPSGTGWGDVTGLIVTSNTTTVSRIGGVSPSTFAWARVSGNASITAKFSNAAATSFSAIMNPDDFFEAVFECTVTDASGAVRKIQANVTLDYVRLTI
jgi:hypothetical protein